jgi:hypothetical protein
MAATKATTADNNTSSPSTEVPFVAIFIKETRHIRSSG